MYQHLRICIKLQLLFEEVLQLWKRVGILVNNAGVGFWETL